MAQQRSNLEKNNVKANLCMSVQVHVSYLNFLHNFRERMNLNIK